MNPKLTNTLVLGALGLFVARSRVLRFMLPLTPFAIALYDLMSSGPAVPAGTATSSSKRAVRARRAVDVIDAEIEAELEAEPLTPPASVKRRSAAVAPKAKRRRKAREAE